MKHKGYFLHLALIQNGKDFTPISGDNFLGPLSNSSFFFKKGIHEYKIFSKYTKNFFMIALWYRRKLIPKGFLNLKVAMPRV
jgi:hypothetical protein